MKVNVAQFIVLGALEELGQGCGYDIKQIFEQKKVYQWIDIKIGSIYHAIKQLNKEGCLHEVGQTRRGQYPTKTIYELTDLGKQRFDALQREAFLGLFPQFYGFKLALKFNTRRSTEEIHFFAEQAIAVIDKKLSEMDTYLRSLDPKGKQYQYDSFFIEHDRRLFVAEKEWIQQAMKNLDLLTSDIRKKKEE